jgi:hypothetical protein
MGRTQHGAWSLQLLTYLPFVFYSGVRARQSHHAVWVVSLFFPLSLLPKISCKPPVGLTLLPSSSTNHPWLPPTLPLLAIPTVRQCPLTVTRV